MPPPSLLQLLCPAPLPPHSLSPIACRMDDVLFGLPVQRDLIFSDRPGIANVFLMDWHYIVSK